MMPLMYNFQDGEKKSCMELLRGRLEYKRSVSCKLCKMKVKAGDSNTSNLRHHIKQHHRQEHVIINSSQNSQRTSTSTERHESENNELSPLAAAFAKSSEYKQDSSKWKSLTDAVKFCIAKDAMPISTVERPGFLHILKKFDEHYTPPSRKTMSKNYLPKLYDVTRDKVLTKLNDIQYFASTTDMWSSRGMTPYLGFTVHFIDNSWKLQQVNLGIRFVPNDHIAETIGLAMQDMLEQWQLDPNKQVCITTDNGSNVNVKKAVQELELLWP